MDKQIKKVREDVKEHKLKKASKDISKLMKMDKVQDKIVDKFKKGKK